MRQKSVKAIIIVRWHLRMLNNLPIVSSETNNSISLCIHLLHPKIQLPSRTFIFVVVMVPSIMIKYTHSSRIWPFVQILAVWTVGNCSLLQRNNRTLWMCTIKVHKLFLYIKEKFIYLWSFLYLYAYSNSYIVVWIAFSMTAWSGYGTIFLQKNNGNMWMWC